MTRPALRARADRLRALPLPELLDLLGAERDPDDPAKWRTAKGTISVSGAKFMNWSRGGGGGGAIDLVIHLRDLDFLEALEWLSRHVPGTVTTDPEPSTPALPRMRELRLPPAASAHLPRVLRYLTDVRHLPRAVIHPLVDARRLYADTKVNAVFLMLDGTGRPVGAELRGTTARNWRGVAPGSRKDLGYFSVDPTQLSAVVLCESAIDALSCHVLYPHLRCLSTAGARPNPAWLPALLAAGHAVRCGFDADPTGEAAALRMIALHPGITRLRPPLHDWNDVLATST
jgi:hypothetical protein